jgi:two-component system sensor kinase FixL
MHTRANPRFSWPALGAAFLGLYLLLEWATYRHDVSPLGITPWNPSAGLSIALLLLLGWRGAPVLALALLAADLTVRHVAFPWWVELAEVAVTVASYTAVVVFLRQRRLAFDPALPGFRDLCILMAAAIAGAMVLALAYTAVLMAAGLLVPGDLLRSTLRLWGGDVLGIMAVTPFILLTRTRQLPQVSPVFVAQVGTIFAAVLVVFSGQDGLREELTYLLFLPIVWIAITHGIVGVSAGLLVMQLCLMIALHLQPSMNTVDIAGLQAVLLILLFAGLAIGVLTSERAQLTARLHQQELRMEQAARLVSVGSFSNSLAHEMSQPLTAIGNFTRAAMNALKGDPPDSARARTAMDQAVTQVDRTIEIMRKLRSLFDSGQVDLAPQDAGTLVQDAVALTAKAAKDQGVLLTCNRHETQPVVMADRVHVGLVLSNLLRNSIEAVAERPPTQRAIAIDINDAPHGFIEFRVSDNGPGFPRDFSLETHEVGRSSKPNGLGIGLGICRSIIEAHGGKIFVVPRSDGATVGFTLRRQQQGSHA